ncbi:MAG: aspartyl-phosphate phosphatase Spo0E family protein [Candidatus Lokiarchaeota archaeon]|nr:aspartyl-phosphate phosphatase Spo0E family protein [Candidatus Lokiarchaeota archaeon]
MKNKIDNLKNKLNIVLEYGEYSEILKISQELDILIVKYMRKNSFTLFYERVRFFIKRNFINIFSYNFLFFTFFRKSFN